MYGLHYRGALGELSAEMLVRVDYRAPDQKEFTIESETGSKALLRHVLHRLLDDEKEATSLKNRTRAALTLDNYSFSCTGVEGPAADRQYLFHVSAKRKDKFLYDGTIWVDAREYAVTRIEAEPAQNPSRWIKAAKITHIYSKVGDYWLPQHNESVSRIRLGGTAILTIDYIDYQISSVVDSDADISSSGEADFPPEQQRESVAMAK